MGGLLLTLAACTGGAEPSARGPDRELSSPEPDGTRGAASREPQGDPSLDGPDELAIRSVVAPRHAVFIVVDTLRADRQQRARTPVMDTLAREGARVPMAWSAGSWTVPSVVSFFTGMSIRQHAYDQPSGKLGRYPRLPEVPMLAEHLSAQGFVADGLYVNPYLAEDLGFDRGFRSWHRSADRAIPAQVAKLVESGWDDGQRHFLYLHFIGPHSPLRPSQEALDRRGLDAAWTEEWLDEKGSLNIGEAKRDSPFGAREAYSQLYDAVIEDTDALIGQTLAALGPHRADTAIVLSSDHGELLGEHDVCGHGYWLWQPLVHVPLVVDNPKLSGAEESLPATLSTASIPALLDELLGLEGSWPTPADQRLPLVAQREGKVTLSPDGRMKGVWHSPNSSAVQVFDLREDPEEEHLLEGDQGLAAARAAWEAATPKGRLGADEVALDAQTVRELEELGYVHEEAGP